jgi:putative PIN family toxin of toxin-antitoxin system
MPFEGLGASVLRLVADTNVVVSALLWRGKPHALFKAAEDHELQFFTTRLLLDELDTVLARRKLTKAVRATGSTRGELLGDYQELAHIVPPAQTRRIVLADPGDDKVLACAIAARAELIVSGDRHLLDLKTYQNIPIINAAEALARLSQR